MLLLLRLLLPLLLLLLLLLLLPLLPPPERPWVLLVLLALPLLRGPQVATRGAKRGCGGLQQDEEHDGQPDKNRRRRERNTKHGGTHRADRQAEGRGGATWSAKGSSKKAKSEKDPTRSAKERRKQFSRIDRKPRSAHVTAIAA
jgi:hypothetical protein